MKIARNPNKDVGHASGGLSERRRVHFVVHELQIVPSSSSALQKTGQQDSNTPAGRRYYCNVLRVCGT
jgi:hypothetical protein